MHAFDRNTGTSYFEFAGPPGEPVFLVGDFNHWRLSSLRMGYHQDRWQLCLKLAEGRYEYAFNGAMASMAGVLPQCPSIAGP